MRDDRWRSDVGCLAMGVTIFRPGQRLVIPGVQVMQPRPSAAASNWWDVAGQTCVAAYAAKGAASLAASYVNLTGNATYNAAPGVAPTWDATGGWTFDGATQYLTTGIVPAQSWSMIIRYSNHDSVEDRYMVGNTASAPTRRFYLSPRSSGKSLYGNGNFFTGTAAAVTSGVLAMAQFAAYQNGTADGTITSGVAVPSLAIYIGARNFDGSANGFCNAKIQALAIYSTTLSGTDVASLTTAMNLL